MEEKERERTKEWIKNIVKQWDEKAKPDYVFLTETSSILYGYPIKEAWKKAYPGEKIPKFYRIDSYPFRQRKVNRDDPDLDAFFKKRIKKKNPKILIYDEHSYDDDDKYNPRGGEDCSQTPEEKMEYTGKLMLFLKKKHHTQDLEKFPGLSLRRVAEYMTNFLEKNKINGEIWGSDQNLLNGGIRPLYGEYSRSPTSKTYRYSNRDYTPDERILSRNIEYISIPLEKRFRASIVRHPEQRKRALEYISEIKSIGKEAGQELFQSNYKKSELEKKIGVFLLMIFTGTFIFTMNKVNLTGRTISNFGEGYNYLPLIGLNLFIIITLIIFIYIKIKKHNLY